MPQLHSLISHVSAVVMFTHLNLPMLCSIVQWSVAKVVSTGLSSMVQQPQDNWNMTFRRH